MIVGVLQEEAPGERRVAVTPETVTQLQKLGYEVVVESGAGAGATFPMTGTRPRVPPSVTRSPRTWCWASARPHPSGWTPCGRVPR